MKIERTFFILVFVSLYLGLAVGLGISLRSGDESQEGLCYATSVKADFVGSHSYADHVCIDITYFWLFASWLLSSVLENDMSY
jgi:hypothetical protein